MTTRARFDPTAVADWLRLVHGDSPGLFYVGAPPRWRGRTYAATDIDAAVNYIRALDGGKPTGVYLRTTTLRVQPASGRGGDNDAYAIPGLAADLDIAGPGHKTTKPLPPDEQSARKIIKVSRLPEPTLWVHSGGGLYPWWLLERPHVITDLDDIKTLSARWQEAIALASEQLGWTYGSVGDLARVLRIPGTVNRKVGMPEPRLCRIVEHAGPRYTLDVLRAAVDEALAALPKPAPQRTQTTQRATTSSEAGELTPGDDYEQRVDWAAILEPHGWTLSHEHGTTRYWVRPGKTRREGHSASTGRENDRDRLYVFTDATEFPQNSPVTKFAAYAILNHGGDYSAAAKDLRRLGYGSDTTAQAAKPKPTPPAPPQPEPGPPATDLPPEPIWDEPDDEPDQAAAQAELELRKRERFKALVDTELDRLRSRDEATRIYTEEKSRRDRAAAAEQARIATGGSFLLDVPALPPALWGRGNDILWADGESLMIAGPQGVGKTTIAGQLLRARLGLMDEVLGYPVASCNGRFLYWAMDRPKQAQRALGRLFNEEERSYLDELLRFWVGPPIEDVAAHPEVLVREALLHEADTVLIDSIKDAAVGLSKDEVGAGYNRARQMLLAEGIQVIELHHVVKNSADGKPPKLLKDIYGSAWLTNGAGSVIMLWGEAGDPIVEVTHLKQPMDPVGPFKIQHNRETGLSSVFYDEDTDVIALARRCATTGITALEAAACLYGIDLESSKPKPAEVEKARRALAKYVEQGLLVQRMGGLGRQVARWFAAAPASWVPDESDERERYR